MAVQTQANANKNTRTGRGSRRHRIEESARGVMTLYTCMQGRRFLSGLLAAAAAAAPASAVVRFRGCGGVCGCPLSRVRLRLRLSAFAGAAAQARLRIPSCSDNNAGPKPFCPKLVSESQYPMPEIGIVVTIVRSHRTSISSNGLAGVDDRIFFFRTSCERDVMSTWMITWRWPTRPAWR